MIANQLEKTLSSFDQTSLKCFLSLAEKVESHEDFYKGILSLFQRTRPDELFILGPLERDFFASCAKKILEKYRSTLRIFSLIRSNKINEQFDTSLASYISRQELSNINEILGILPTLLGHIERFSESPDVPISSVIFSSKPEGQSVDVLHLEESWVLYKKMIADYLRYRTEVYYLHAELLKPFLLRALSSPQSSEAPENEQSHPPTTPLSDKEKEVLQMEKGYLCEQFGLKETDPSVQALLDVLEERIRELIEETKLTYETALSRGLEKLQIHNHILLGAVVNYTVFLYEIDKKEAEAIETAGEYYEKALESMGKIDDSETFEKTNMVLVTLKDNIDGWKAEKKTFERKSVVN